MSLLYGQLCKQARWIKSCTVIGYLSEQDGAILPALDYPQCPTLKISPKAIYRNKSFIYQVCSVKMAGYWPPSFFACLWILITSWSSNMQKMNLANIQPSWPHTWSITRTVCIVLGWGEGVVGMRWAKDIRHLTLAAPLLPLTFLKEQDKKSIKSCTLLCNLMGKAMSICKEKSKV